MGNSIFHSVEEENYARLRKAIEVIASMILRVILAACIRPYALSIRVNQGTELSSILTYTQKKKIKDAKRKHNFEEFDFALCYILLKNICTYKHVRPMILQTPTQGWGKKPKPSDLTLSDDIERLRFMKDMLPRKHQSIAHPEFQRLLNDLRMICTRMDGHYEKGFERELDELDSVELKWSNIVTSMKKLQAKLKQIDQLETDLRTNKRRVDDHDEIIKDHELRLDAQDARINQVEAASREQGKQNEAFEKRLQECENQQRCTKEQFGKRMDEFEMQMQDKEDAEKCYALAIQQTPTCRPFTSLTDKHGNRLYFHDNVSDATNTNGTNNGNVYNIGTYIHSLKIEMTKK